MGTPATTTSMVYVHVIDDVINKVRDDIVNNGGPGESVLLELQAMWEMKMMQAGAIVGPIDRSGTSKTGPGGGPIRDLNVPYEGTEEYETPTAEMLFPPTPMATPMPTPLPTPLPSGLQSLLPGSVQTPLPGSFDNSSMYNIPTGPSSDYPTPVSDTGGNTESKPGRPSTYMPPPSPWMNQRQPLDVNIAYVEGRDEMDRGASHQALTQDFFMEPSGKRKREDFAAQHNNGGFIPQQDGAGDAMPNFFQESMSSNTLRHSRSTTVNVQILPHAASSSLKIPQQDGPIPDPFEDMLSTPNIYNYQGAVNEDYNIASTPAPTDQQANTPATVVPQQDTVDEEDDEELLNEDDDDEEDADDVDDGEELSTQHLVLAQFDKVTRAKNRWKCTLKDGIMHINNKDILFNKATGEFEF